MKELMTEYFDIVDKWGYYSSQESRIINANATNKEFTELTNKLRRHEIEPIRVVVEDGGRLPERKHSDDLGLDIFPLNDYDLEPMSGGRFRTGIKMLLRDGGELRDKSSSAWDNIKNVGKHVIVNGGVIDPAYRGEIIVILFNLGISKFEIRRNKSFVQLITKGKCIEVTQLPETIRGEKGFGQSLGDFK